MAIETRQLGTNGPRVFPIALGCMGMSGMYGPADEQESIATIHAAIDAGINLIDTGDFYGMGHNEMLIGRAIKGHRDKVLLSVKFGALRGPDGSWVGYDARPPAIRNFLAYTLTRLGVDYVDTYRPARLDPNVPIEETVGTIAKLIEAGHARYLGLSEMSDDTVRRAHSVYPVSDLQIEYAVITRSPERKVFPALRELGIGVTAYGVLSRGLLSSSRLLGDGDTRRHFPRFAESNAAQNRTVVDSFRQLAADRNITPAQLAIAWVLAKDNSIVPVIGARTRSQLAESLKSLEVRLSPEEVAHIEAFVPSVVGTRYDERQMRLLDSER
jgi:aryl-alcohol dehydrogenase-like predicted oxidoreductase